MEALLDLPADVLDAPEMATREARIAGPKPNSTTANADMPAVNRRARRIGREVELDGPWTDTDESLQRLRRPQGKQQPHPTCQCRQQNAFGEMLPQNPRAARAKRQADNGFSPTRGRSGEQEVRNVRTRDEQHHADEDSEDLKRLLIVGPLPGIT